MTVVDAARRSELRKTAMAATQGEWEARDLSDTRDGFNSEDERGWWWVWRKNCPHFAGVVEVQTTYKAPDGWERVGCSIGEAQITDAQLGDVERADAVHIAAFDPPTVLALLDQADEAERLRANDERRHLILETNRRMRRSAEAERDALQSRVDAVEKLCNEADSLLIGRGYVRVDQVRAALRGRQ